MPECEGLGVPLEMRNVRGTFSYTISQSFGWQTQVYPVV
jgi:hypothetical protein